MGSGSAGRTVGVGALAQTYGPSIVAGRTMSAAAAQQVEKTLTGNPNDLEARAKLLTYYTLSVQDLRALPVCGTWNGSFGTSLVPRSCGTRSRACGLPTSRHPIHRRHSGSPGESRSIWIESTRL